MLAQTVGRFSADRPFLAGLYFLFRQQIRMAGKARLTSANRKRECSPATKNKITFRDVAGVEEAKDEVQELVEFLRRPEKISEARGRIPKGVLMVVLRARQDFAGPRHRRRSGLSLLFHQRLGLCREFVGVGRKPCPRHVRAGQKICARALFLSTRSTPLGVTEVMVLAVATMNGSRLECVAPSRWTGLIRKRA